MSGTENPVDNMAGKIIKKSSASEEFRRLETIAMSEENRQATEVGQLAYEIYRKAITPELSPDRQALVDAIEKCRAILVDKEKAYSNGQDRFINFKSANVVTDGFLSPLQYAWTLPNKHVEALTQLFFSQTQEEYEDRGGAKAAQEYLSDIANYCLLMMAMVSLGMSPVNKKE